MGSPIGRKMIEWRPSGGRVDAIVTVKKGRLRGADVIREPLDVELGGSRKLVGTRMIAHEAQIP